MVHNKALKLKCERVPMAQTLSFKSILNRVPIFKTILQQQFK